MLELSQEEPFSTAQWLKEKNHHFIHMGDAHYPDLLKQIHRPPAYLYAKGNIELLNEPQIAIVGSRNMSPYGRDNARAFARYLAECGLTITSGMALGIDGVAHESALDVGGSTIAVLGSGVDVVYPQRHQALYQRILDNNGLIVSPFGLGMPARRTCFVQRNRIISGLSIGTLVVEAAIKSGSLTTARFALEQCREVFAIPGSIHHSLSKGCHYLLKNGAKCVESGQDILEECQAHLNNVLAISKLDADHHASSNEASTELLADEAYQALLAAIGAQATSVDQIQARTQMHPCEIASMLLMLELQGQIEAVPGGYMKQ